MNKRKALGKDLSALLGDLAVTDGIADTADTPEHSGEGIADIDIRKISRAARQSRQVFDADKIAELANSIRASGLLQPIIVRPKPGGEDEYELVAGERRWRAAQAAGLTNVPSIVRKMDDNQAAVLGLMENVQRQDLGPYEQAVALKELMTTYSYTQQALGERLGMPRASIANLLRLLNLAPAARQLLRDGLLDPGHAKVILSLPPPAQEQAAAAISAKKLNVRQAEQLVRRLSGKRSDSGKPGGRQDPDIRALGDELSDQLGVSVSFAHRKDGGGKMTVNYSNLEELDRILVPLRGGGKTKTKTNKK